MSAEPAPRILRPHEFRITSVVQEVELPHTASCRIAYVSDRGRHLHTLWEGRTDLIAVRRFVIMDVPGYVPGAPDTPLAEDLIVRWVAASLRWGFIALCEIDEYRRAQINEQV